MTSNETAKTPELIYWNVKTCYFISFSLEFEGVFFIRISVP